MYGGVPIIWRERQTNRCIYMCSNEIHVVMNSVRHMIHIHTLSDLLNAIKMTKQNETQKIHVRTDGTKSRKMEIA